ncbi:MAG: hypothetical protein ACYCS7_03450 [Acidimicrobiales bacterium]
MTLLVVLLLVIVWVVVLAPSFLRHRAEGSLNDSVGSFHRNLRILERAGPGGVAPANSMRALRPQGSYTGLSERMVGSASIAYPSAVRSQVAQPQVAQPQVAARAQVMRRRRRDVFMVLVTGTMGSFLLGFIPGVSIMWAVTGVLALCLAGYVALLIRIRNNAVEREMKLSFLPSSVPMGLATTSRSQPAFALRRSAN